MLDKIKYIAAYQTQPVSAITHYAPVARIEPYGEDVKFKLIFSDKAKPIGPIPYADAPTGAMQGRALYHLCQAASGPQINGSADPISVAVGSDLSEDSEPNPFHFGIF